MSDMAAIQTDVSYNRRVFWKDHEYGGGAWYWVAAVNGRDRGDPVGPFDSAMDAGRDARKSLIEEFGNEW